MAYKVGVTINSPDLKRLKSVEELAGKVEEFLRILSTQLNAELQKISRTSPETTGDIVIKNVVGKATAPSVPAPAAELNYRANTLSVVTAGTSVVFVGGALPDTDYTILATNVDSNNRPIPFAISLKAVNGFTVTPLRNATFTYLSIAYK